ncbi:hypothetical protein GCM10009133_09510 [Cocleimonas flava]|uniref:Uncharacterized protein DUF481 n=1 Tax=Cocleimonas flava TaxID=634765 RepID=A0A4R1F433_9GAMM|nr:DUF481 domain-containing protein [Cocleimonas flava]TCJ87314.1 uncharacterized protein DUF481 [Cocleimonas flava]
MTKQSLLKVAISTAIVSIGSTPLWAEPLITDYEKATSAYEDAYFSGNLNLDSGNQDQTSYDLDLSIDYEKVFSSKNRNTKLDFLGTGTVSRGSSDGDDRESTYQALGSVTVDNYFNPDKSEAFWYGKGEVGLKKGQEDPFTKATAGVGYGRVINVTPMARSIRIIQELKENGFIKADPTNATYQQVAQIIEREAEYRSKYGFEDYEQYWVQDIETALKASGMTNGATGLNARAILKSYDVLVNERISTRKSGWLVRAGVGAVLSDYDGEDGKPALEIGAEYHKPLSNRTQFSNEAIATATLKDGDDSFNFNNAMSLTHELTDKIDWENKWTLDHNESDIGPELTTNTIGSTFLYSLTNKLDFSVEAKLTDTDDRIADNGNDDLDKSLTMGVRYRLK